MTTATPRPTFCLLGLPFDPLSLPEAEQVLRNGVAAGEAGILSTPNLNWIALARQNPAFRQSVLISDCCVADGMPLVWLARLLGLPFPERVSGADLIERLRKGRPSLRVFFFGGLGDVAERAVSALRRSPGGLVAVGSLNPGQGTVESMSSESMIAAINACRPDIVIVSLGAEKGQAWIVRNRAVLDAAWVTHLGAVVNFFAGEVNRAPPLIGRLGLEWIWRTIQEPKLAQRYWRDGKLVLGLLLTRVLPLLVHRALARRTAAPLTAKIGEITTTNSAWISVALAGDFCGNDALLLEPLTQRALTAARSLRIDLADLAGCDSATLGQLMIIYGRLEQAGQTLELVNATPRVLGIFRGHCAEFLMPAAGT